MMLRPLSWWRTRKQERVAANARRYFRAQHRAQHRLDVLARGEASGSLTLGEREQLQQEQKGGRV